MMTDDMLIDAPPPGLDPGKWKRLAGFLSGLTPTASARLFAALELAESRGDAGLPTRSMLSIIRTRLLSEHGRFPARAPSARRLFFAPFEDFFVPARAGRKRRARIARASIAPIWDLLTNDPACAAAGSAAAHLDAAIARGESDLSVYEAALFSAAAAGVGRLIAHAENDASFRADLGERLGGRDAQAAASALHDLAEINLLLSITPHLKSVRRAFEKPAPAPTEEELFEARAIYAAAYKDAPEIASYALLAVAARLDAPWRALKLHYHMAGVSDEAIPAAREDAALIAEALFDDLESQARALERDAEDDLDTDDTVARVMHFADYANGVVAEATEAGDAVTVNRAEACRDIAATALVSACEQAQGLVRKTQPVRHAGGSSRLMGLRPDTARTFDRITEARAKSGAQFIARAGALAERLGRPAAASEIATDVISHTRRYAGDLILEIRAGEGEERAAARRRMDATLSIAAHLLPAAEIALLKERAAAAAVSA